MLPDDVSVTSISNLPLFTAQDCTGNISNTGTAQVSTEGSVCVCVRFCMYVCLCMCVATCHITVSCRFCRQETSCEQEDYYPRSCYLKVNDQYCPLPVSCSEGGGGGGGGRGVGGD